MEVFGVENGCLMYRWSRHFQTSVFVVAIVSAVSMMTLMLSPVSATRVDGPS